MKIAKMLRTPSILCIAVAMSTAGFQAPVLADMVDTADLVMQAELQIQRDDVRSFMARDDVRSAMLGYGVSADEVETRINNLTESELLQIQNRMSQLPAGGDALGIVLTILLVLVLLDVLGVTNIFPRI
jgi:hypothetical protein